MTENQAERSELYFLPSFYSGLSNQQHDIDRIVEERYEENNHDLYTELRGVINDSIAPYFKEIRYIPLSLGVLDYESDDWDFSQYTLISHSLHLHFSNVPAVFKDIVKNYMLLEIISGNIKATTLCSHFHIISSTLNYLYELGVDDIRDIDETYVSDFVDSLYEDTEVTAQSKKTRLLDFLLTYGVENNIRIVTEEISELLRPDTARLQAEAKNNHRCAIPTDYFNRLLSVMMRIMNDTTETADQRAHAAILVIQSQTGLRASELSLLTSDAIEEISIDNKVYRMLHYKIMKTAKTTAGYKKNITFANDISFAAYSVLMNVYADNRISRNTDLLFCPQSASLPVNATYYNDYLKYICINNADEIGCFQEKYKPYLWGRITAKGYIHRYVYNKDIATNMLSKYPGITMDTVFYIPITHQFRNTVVDRLLRNGVSIEFVRRFMGHLTEEMTAGYASYNDTDMQENMEFSQETIRTYVTGEAKILGSSGESLMARIDEWIAEHHLTAAENLDEIVDGLTKLVPIRAKHGGMCIKGAKLTDACSVDSNTDEFFCACGICPNVCHFYFMANVSYSDFKATLEIFQYNQDNGFERQTQKEAKKLQYIVQNRLLPELSELKKEISNRGAEDILTRHPELKTIAENMDKIEKEIEPWTTMKNYAKN